MAAPSRLVAGSNCRGPQGQKRTLASIAREARNTSSRPGPPIPLEVRSDAVSGRLSAGSGGRPVDRRDLRPDVCRARTDFRRDAGHQLRPRRFHDAGHVCRVLLLHGARRTDRLGNVVGPFVAILLAGPILAVFGYAVHRTLISRVSGTRTSMLEGEGHYAQLVLTLGIALILQNGGLIIFGSVLASIRTPLSSTAWELGPFFDVSVFVNKARGIDAVVSLMTMTLLALLITRSRLGKSLRAAADNPVAATYMRVDVDRAHRIAFALGTGVTAIAGGLLATNYPFQPFVGLEYVIVMYAGVVL